MLVTLKGQRVTELSTHHMSMTKWVKQTLSRILDKDYDRQITIKLPKFLLLIISGAYFVKTCTPGRTNIFSLPFPSYHPLFNLYERSEVMGKPVV